MDSILERIRQIVSDEQKSKRQQSTKCRRGTITGVTSGRGGTGKTFFAIALAAEFSKLNQKTLLVDGDPSLPNCGAYLGIAPKSDLAAVISGRIDLANAVTPIDGGNDGPTFDFLPGQSGSVTLAEPQQDEVAKLAAGISSLSAQYDQIIIDIGAGIETTGMLLARASDRAIIVATDEPALIVDTYAYMKTLKGYAPDLEQQLLVNRVETEQAGCHVFHAVARATQTFLGFKPIHFGTLLRAQEVSG